MTQGFIFLAEKWPYISMTAMLNSGMSHNEP